MRTAIVTVVVSFMLGAVAWSGDDVVSLEEAERLSDERHVFMKELGKSMRTIKGFLSGRNDAEEALAATGVLKDAASAIPTLFPPGTGVDALPRTGALDAIWENWTEFEMAAQLLGERAAMLETALTSGDDDSQAAAFEALGRDGCGGCHSVFRAKDH